MGIVAVGVSSTQRESGPPAYLSWCDGNPAHLHEHPPVEAGKQYVEFMGRADEVLAKARKSFEAGDYRWVAEVVNNVVFADPTNAAVKELEADTLEQLGYQTESASSSRKRLIET